MLLFRRVFSWLAYRRTPQGAFGTPRSCYGLNIALAFWALTEFCLRV